MAHRYGQPVHVSVRGGVPVGFRLCGVEYQVREVLSTWHRREHWWPPAPTTHVPAQSDRTFFRVRCPDERVFDLYFDDVSGLWVLDRAHD